MGKVTWSAPALDDLERIYRFYAEVAPAFAESLINTYFDKTQILAEFPRMGSIVPEYDMENIRQLIDNRYRIIYTIAEATGDIAVVGVLSNRQLHQPGSLLTD